MIKRCFLIAVLLGTPAWSAPLVDINHSTQARDAIGTLQARGLIQGYPDGTSKGDRAMSRYEVSNLLDRLDQMLLNETNKLSTQVEVKTVKDSVQALVRSLDDLGGRVTENERQVDVMEKRP